jgi:hypothetical protein
MVDRGDEDNLDTAIAALLRAYAGVVTALHSLSDPARQFARATELGDVLRKLVSESTDERAIAAARIVEAESLSLTALGERISMSKQRAGKLVEKGRKARGSGDDD